MDIAQVDENQREKGTARGGADEILEPALRHRPIGKLRQRVMIKVMLDIRFALRDVSLHRVESRGKAAELVASGDRDRRSVLTLLNAARGQNELADRPRGAPAEQRADQGRQYERDAIDR